MASKHVGRAGVQLAALFLIGDGLMGLIGSIVPRWHSLVWHVGPQLAKAATEELEANRTAARVVYGAEAALGLTLLALENAE